MWITGMAASNALNEKISMFAVEKSPKTRRVEISLVDIVWKRKHRTVSEE